MVNTKLHILPLPKQFILVYDIINSMQFLIITSHKYSNNLHKLFIQHHTIKIS